jgi:hypothetical protein
MYMIKIVFIEVFMCPVFAISISMKDITILYQGGSGGFALYYYLLLTGQYQFDIPTVKCMITQQFDTKVINNRHAWKSQEFWPENKKLKLHPGPSVFLICNPFFNPGVLEENLMVAENTCKVLLYTDLKLQLRLAWEKQAYWFTEVSRREFRAPANDRRYIKEIIKTHGLQDPLIGRIQTVFKPHIMIRLEEFLKSKSILDLSANSDQMEFLNHWYDLQSAKSRKLLDRVI